MKNGPSPDCVNECTDEMTPLRVRNVPKMVSEKVSSTRTMFQTRSMSFFSWIITEWRIRGRHEPRHEGRVLDRIPRPVAAPAEHLVRPHGAEEVAEAQEEPREQRPAPRRADPLVAEPPRRQRRDREGERHRRAHVAGVERRRVDHHPVVLQQRIQVGALDGGRGQALEGIGDEGDQAEEEHRHGHQRGRDPRHQLAVALAVLPLDDRGEERQHEGPEEQRALLAAPQRRERRSWSAACSTSTRRRTRARSRA